MQVSNICNFSYHKQTAVYDTWHSSFPHEWNVISMLWQLVGPITQCQSAGFGLQIAILRSSGRLAWAWAKSVQGSGSCWTQVTLTLPNCGPWVYVKPVKEEFCTHVSSCAFSTLLWVIGQHFINIYVFVCLPLIHCMIILGRRGPAYISSTRPTTKLISWLFSAEGLTR